MCLRHLAFTNWTSGHRLTSKVPIRKYKPADQQIFLLMTHKRNKKHKMLNVSGNRK